jgi:hypothetical protein
MRGFKLWHSTSGTPATVQWCTGLVRKNERIKNKTQTHMPHEHAQKLSSCRKNIVLFHETGDNYFPYSSSTKKRWKYFWQHCVNVHKTVIGGALTGLNYI